MMNSEAGMDPLTASTMDPLTASTMSDGGNDDASSVSSQRSAGGRSLLERIQMQRQRDAEAAATATGHGQGPPPSMTPQQIQIPNYGPMPGIGNTPSPGPTGSAPDGSFLSNAWTSLSQMGDPSAMGMSGTIMSDGVPNNVSHHLEDGINDALLPPSARLPSDDYSMANYFMTFVKDVTGLFSRLHIVPRVILFLALLYVAIKLL